MVNLVHREKSRTNRGRKIISLLSSIFGSSREFISSAEIPSDWSRNSRGKHVETDYFSCASAEYCPRGGDRVLNWSVSDTGPPKLRLFGNAVAKMGVFARFTVHLQPRLKLVSPFKLGTHPNQRLYPCFQSFASRREALRLRMRRRLDWCW